MSRQSEPTRRVTVPEIVQRKGKAKIVALTAYTAPMASLLDPHADILLVGDSVGMVVHGLPGTQGVTLEMMILHGKAVMRGSERALVAVDLPFGSYEASPEQAFASATRLIGETGCQAVKLETHADVERTVAFLVGRGIPVIGHVGLRPQASNAEGGFKAKGRTEAERQRVIAEAKAATDAGAFTLVIEGVSADLGASITHAVTIPTIGIGAGAECDGQILVTEDMLGLFEWTPKFVRRYANLGPAIQDAAKAYAADIQNGSFPAEKETYRLVAKS